MCGNCSDPWRPFSPSELQTPLSELLLLPSEIPTLVEEPRPVDLIDRNWNRGKW